MDELVLEKEIHHILQSSSKLREYNKKLQNKCIKQEKEFDRDIQKLQSYELKLIDEIKQLRIKNTDLTSETLRKEFSLSALKSDITTKSNNIKSLQSMIKKLECELASSQKDSSKKESDISSLKSRITDKDLSLSNFKDMIRTKSKEMKDVLSKIEALKTKLSSAQKDLSTKESEIDPLRTELSALNSNLVSKNSELVYMKNVLASKDDELERMKNDLALKISEIHSLESKLSSEPIKIGGGVDEKKISNSADISADSKPIKGLLSKYLCKKNMEPSKKNNTGTSPYKDNELIKNIQPELSVPPQPTHRVIPIDPNPEISVGSIDIIPPVTGVLSSGHIFYILVLLLIAYIIWNVVKKINHKNNIREVIYRDTIRGY